MEKSNKSVFLTAGLGVIWAVAIGCGLWVLLKYESTPGRTGAVPASWPNGSIVSLSKNRPTLIMIAHPYCPCTRASMDELERVMAQAYSKVDTYVLFYTPADSNPGGAAQPPWENSELRRRAMKIPGVTVLSDVNGAEAHRFGAETSGHTFLFDPKGRLLFNGGITQSRGHAGDNDGESAIISLISKSTSPLAKTLVFGCSLTDRGGKRTCLK